MNGLPGPAPQGALNITWVDAHGGWFLDARGQECTLCNSSAYTEEYRPGAAAVRFGIVSDNHASMHLRPQDIERFLDDLRRYARTGHPPQFKAFQDWNGRLCVLEPDPDRRLIRLGVDQFPEEGVVCDNSMMVLSRQNVVALLTHIDRYLEWGTVVPAKFGR